MIDRFSSLCSLGPRLLMVAALVGATTLSGCATLKEMIGLGFQNPKVTLQAVEVGKVTMSTMHLKVRIKVDNPNSEPLIFTDLYYRIYLIDAEVASGHFRERGEVPAKKSSEIVLPIEVDLPEVLDVMKKVLADGEELVASIRAMANFETRFGTLNMSFEDSRKLANIPQF